LCGALVYGELGAVMPRSGGEYHYLREIYHPLLGFMSGWASLIVGFAAPVALACMALSTYLHKMFPAFNPLVTAITVLTAVTLIHAYDVKMGGTLQRCLPSSRYHHHRLYYCGLFAASRTSRRFLCGNVLFRRCLFNRICRVAHLGLLRLFGLERLSLHGQRNSRTPTPIPRSLFISTVIVTILYLLLNAVFLFAAPVEAMQGQVEVGLIAARYIFGEWGGNLMGCSLLCCWCRASVPWLF
jgi:APA family basic amino acid/polyamine antiporter